MSDDLIARAVNAASYAAANAVYEYAARYPDRGDYLPLEELAREVQRAAVEAGARVARERNDNTNERSTT